MITMTRRVMFSAAHALWNSDWTPDANRAVYGTAANPEPTGHNYTLDVAVTGKIHPHTGILVNIKEIDQIVRERVVEVVNNRSLNRAVPAFRYQPVTPENLTEFIRGSLADAMPVGVTLSGIRLEWSPLHVVEWTSKEPNTMQVTQIYEFSASHRLHSEHLSETENEELFGKCNRLNGHGHNYIFEVTVAGTPDTRTGRVIDGETLDAIVNAEIVERYDHRHLNLDIPEFQTQIPSAEIITKVIYERLADKIPAPARLSRVVVRETARNIFEYSGEDTN